MVKKGKGVLITIWIISALFFIAKINEKTIIPLSNNVSISVNVGFWWFLIIAIIMTILYFSQGNKRRKNV